METLIDSFTAMMAGAYLWIVRGFCFAAGAYLFFALFVHAKLQVKAVIQRTGDDEGRGL